MVVREGGRMTDVRAVQPANAPSPMVKIESAIITLVIASSSSKADSPMAAKEEGTLTFVPETPTPILKCV